MNNDYNEDREPLNTKSMLENSFFDNLSKIGKNTIKELPKISEAQFNTEKLLLELFDTRDLLIEFFSKTGAGQNSKPLINSINRVSSCIGLLGGDAPDFDPFIHLSGLQVPNIKKNATRVIENTKDSYSIGKIDQANVSDDGKTLTITFSGQQDNTDYKAVGTIVANKNWVGNEAVDYIYSNGSGRMSVKVFNEEGKWVDKSDIYKISWELFEKEADLNVMSVEIDRESETKQTNKDNKRKEEIEIVMSNDNIDEEIGDFPIEEKNN
jgi:hypothetical protein